MNRAAILVALLAALAGCSRRQSPVSVPPAPSASPAPAAEAPPAPQPPKRTPAPPPRPAERTRTETPEAPPATERPRLEPLTPAEVRTAQIAEIDGILRKAEQNAAELHTRQLPAAFAQELERVDSLIRQARAAQAASDLPSARSFATRSLVLSTDLLKR